MTEVEHIHRSIADNGNALFGKYELGRLLGCGAFAKVYYARNVVSGQSVAVKVINKKKLATSSSGGGGLAGNIKREISIMRRLHHPNVVQLHEVLATRTKIYFVMEFVKGGELFAKVAKGRFTEDLSRKYFQQLVSAIGHCHVRGVFHRDLKPENLLVDDGGNLKVSDFGLSAVRDQIRSDGLLHTLCGTPAYVAPEILSKRGYDGAKVDVWSCGVVLFVLNAGYLPFNDPNLMSMYKKIYKGEFRCPKWMSADLKRFLHRVLDTNPATRITIEEIVADPWFKRGLKSPINFYGDDLTAKKNESDLITKPTNLNAFDLISFSSGLDLSGLFDDSFNTVEDGERFLSTESPEKVVAKAEAFAKEEDLRFKKNNKDWDVEMEGRNGNLALGVGVYLLTDGLVVVEVRRIGGEAAEFRDVWKNKLKPRLMAVAVEEAMPVDEVRRR